MPRILDNPDRNCSADPVDESEAAILRRLLEFGHFSILQMLKPDRHESARFVALKTARSTNVPRSART
jgi:hypothetical protein